MNLRWRVALVGLATAGLTACATAPLPAPSPSPLVSGRLSVQVAGQPERSVSGGFELAGDIGQGTLSLTGPLGTTALRARWAAGEAVLASGGRESRFVDLDALAQATLGEPIPMAALFDWLRGRPWPGAAALARSDGTAGFAQLGWQVSLARWDDGLVEAVRLQAPTVTVRARVER